MSRSVLEGEASRFFDTLKNRMATHDRGVLLGFLLSFAPIFPLPIVSLSLSTFHYFAYRSGKIEKADFSLVRLSVFIALASLLVSLGLLLLVVSVLKNTEWAGVTQFVIDSMHHLRYFFNFSTPSVGGTSI